MAFRGTEESTLETTRLTKINHEASNACVSSVELRYSVAVSSKAYAV